MDKTNSKPSGLNMELRIFFLDTSKLVLLEPFVHKGNFAIVFTFTNPGRQSSQGDPGKVENQWMPSWV